MPIFYDDGLFEFDDKVRVNSPGSVVHGMLGTISDFEDGGVYVRFATVTPAMMGYEDARRGLVYFTDPAELAKVTEEPKPANWIVILFKQDSHEGTETVEGTYGPFGEKKAEDVATKVVEWARNLIGPCGIPTADKWRCHIMQLEELPYAH